jgi:putative ABC transport system permease protein
MEVWRSDLRHAWRQLRRRPGFAAVVVGTLALGIGANAAIFAVAYPALLRPLPYRDAGRLVWIGEQFAGLDVELTPAADYVDWRDQARTLSAVGAWVAGAAARLTGHGEPQRVPIVRASASLLPTLGVEPAIGRNFSPQEERGGGPGAVLVAPGLWDRLFGPDVALSGQALTLDGTTHEVVGILPSGFTLPGVLEADVVLPLGLDEERERARLAMNIVSVVGRVGPGVGVEAVRAELDSIRRGALGPTAAESVPPANGGHPAPDEVPGESPTSAAPASAASPWLDSQLRIVPLRDHMVGGARRPLVLLLAVVGVVLLATCFNVASLMLARAAEQQREIAVRAAVGADPRRLVGRCFVESALFAILGGLAGVALGLAGVCLLRYLVPLDLANGVFRHLPIVFDRGVLLYVLAAAVTTTLVSGTAPALLAARADPADALRRRGFARSQGGRRARRLFVIAEVASSTVLLVAAGLLVRSFARVLAVDLGFSTERLLTLEVDVGPQQGAGGAPQVALWRELLQRVEAVPGVSEAALADSVPLTPFRTTLLGLELAGSPAPSPAGAPSVGLQSITPRFPQVLGLRLVRGRGFVEGDSEGAEPVALVNAALARRYFGDADPVGQTLQVPAPSAVEARVVGVVADKRHGGPESEPALEVYRPWAQEPAAFAYVILRGTRPEPASLLADVRRAIGTLGAGITVRQAAEMEGRLRQALALRRFQMQLVSLFAALSLALAAVGLYGVLACRVAERRLEVGIRMTLGATPREVLALVAGHAAGLVAVGAGAGLLIALGVSRFLRASLFGVPATDTVTLVGAPILLAAVALCAALVPARRALAVDPVKAMLQE